MQEWPLAPEQGKRSAPSSWEEETLCALKLRPVEALQQATKAGQRGAPGAARVGLCSLILGWEIEEDPSALRGCH